MNDHAAPEAELDALLEALPCAVWAYDSAYRLRLANAAAWAMAGLSPAQLPYGTPLHDAIVLMAHRGLLGTGDPAGLIEAYQKLDRTQVLRRRIRRADGSVIEVTSQPLPGGGLLNCALDISAVVQSGERAEADARRLEDVLHRLHAGLAVYDPDSRLVLNNASYERLLGLPRGSAQPGVAYLDLLRELARRGEFANTDPEALLADRARIDRSRPYRQVRQRPNGQVLQLESQPAAEGGWLVELTDITRLKQAEDEASGRAALLRGVLEAIPLGVMVVGPDMRVAMVNSRCEEFFGDSGIVIGEHREDLARRRALAGAYGEGDIEELVAANLTVVGAGPVLRQRVRPDGRVLEIRAAPTPDGGYVQVMGDITELHRARAEATARAEQMRVMLDHMRHGIALFGPDERLVAANALAERLAGVAPGSMRPGVLLDELRAEQIAAGEFGEDRASAAALAVSRHAAFDKTQPHRYTRTKRDGTVLEVLSDPTPDGGFVRTYVDITLRARAEAALRAQAETLQVTLDNIQHGIALYGPDRRLRLANRLSGPNSGLPLLQGREGALFDDLVDEQAGLGMFGADAQARAIAAEVKALDRRLRHRYLRRLPDGRAIDIVSAPTPDGGFIITHSEVTELERARAEATQRATLLQAMLDTIQHGIAVYDRDGRLVLSNALAAEYCGLHPDDMRPGRLQADLIRLQHARGALGTGPAAEAFMHQGLARDWHAAARFQRTSAEGQIIDITVNPMPDGGYVLGWSDITALVAAQAEAANRAGLLQVMMDSMRHGIALFDSEHRLVMHNALAARLTGLPVDGPAQGSLIEDVLRLQQALGTHGEDHTQWVAALDRSLPHRYLRPRPGGGTLEVGSDPTPDGGFVLTLTDVTPLVRMEEEAKRRAAILQAMLDNMRHGIVLFDAERRLVACNALAMHHIGLPEDLARPGTSMEAMLRAQVAAGMATEEQAAFAAGMDRSVSHRYLRAGPDGSTIEVGSDPTPDGGWVITYSDVSSLARMEAEAQRRATILQVMLDNMRHGIALYDANQRLVMANGLAARLNGVESDGTRIGASMAEIMAEQEALGHVSPAVARQQLELDRSQSHRQMNQLPDGSILEVRSDPTPDGGFVCTYSDVTELNRARAEAQDRADLLQLMLDNMRHGIVRYDAERRLVTANRLALELHGLPPETDLRGMREPDIVRLLYERGEVDEPAWRGSKTADITTRRRSVRTRANGQVVLFTAEPTPDGGYVVTISDITDVVQAEEAAKQRARVLNVMLENIRHGICYYGPDRRVIAANTLAARLGGHRETALEPGALIDDLIEDQIASGAVPPGQLATAVHARTMDRSVPSQYTRRSGDGRVLEITSDPTPDGGFVVTSTDVTRLAEAETVAQQRAEMLGVMLDNIRHGIVLFDAQWRIAASNPRVGRMLGVDASVTQPGLHLHDYIRRLAAAGVYGSDAEAMARAEATIGRFDPRRPNQHVRTGPRGEIIEVVSDPTPDGGFVLTYTDVTEDRGIRAELQAAREAAEAANKAKSRFLATMTHELRTPLNAVIGFSEALQTAPDKERAGEYLRSIHDAGRHLLSLIDDILDVTRAETTGFQVAEGEVDLVPLCEGSIRVMRAAAASGGVRLALELADPLPMVRADEVRLRQVLLNLLSNAVKFTPADGSVTLSAAVEQDGGLVIRVTDTGIGVKPEDLPRAFQPFSQLDSSLSRRFPGSGLGLYLSRALAEAQGATLTLQGGEGVGAIAVLRFPPDRLLPPAGNDHQPPPFAP